MGRIRFIYSVLAKIFVFIFFGLGAIFLSIFVLPVERLIFHPVSRFKQVGRRTISGSHRLVIWLCKVLGVVKISGEIDASKLGGKIIAPNHPSLLDVVILFAYIPGANCIVRSALMKSVVGVIVKDLYIPNNEDFEQLQAECKESLSNGDTLIIFPEGTRTRPGKPITLKRGIAFISLFSGAPIVPVFISGNEKKGLLKHDKVYRMPKCGYYSYHLEVGEEIDPADFMTSTKRNNTIALTEQLQKCLREGNTVNE